MGCLRKVSIAFSLLVCVTVVHAEPLVAPGEFVVTLRPSVPGGALAARARGALGRFRQHRALGARAALLLDRSGNSRELPKPADPDDLVCKRLLREHPELQSCSQNFRLEAQTTPDPELSTQWGLSAIAASEGWEIAADAASVIVAVEDSGVDYRHPDLAANVWVNAAEVPGNGVDDDHNGYTDDVHGINTIRGDGDPIDDNGHGTHVAGILGAVRNNGIGGAGVAPSVRILPVKFLAADGSGYLSDAIQGIEYLLALKARGENVRILNASWGGGAFAAPLEDAIRQLNEAGIVFVAAAGNEKNDNDTHPSFPASYAIPNVVAVAATDASGVLASFSNRGESSVGIAAPGVGILSTYPGGEWRSYSGTSMAAPFVSGALALLFAKEPTLSVAAAVERVSFTGQEQAALIGLVRGGRQLHLLRLLTGEGSALPEVSVSRCPYEIEPVPFDPDVAGLQAPVVAGGDELDYAPVELPGTSRVFGEVVGGRAYLSMNGVLYFQESPGEVYDYQNGALPPPRSVALLHTDLLASGAARGVRYLVSGSRAIATWQVAHYRDASRSPLTAQLIIDGHSGEIWMYYQLPRAARVAVESSYTIGVRGELRADSLVLGHNTTLQESFGFHLTPRCESGSPSQSGGGSLSARIGTVRGHRLGVVYRGRPAFLEVQGPVAGVARVTLAINGMSCPLGTDLALQSAQIRRIFRLPATISPRLRRLDVRVGEAVARARVVGAWHGSASTWSTRGRALSDQRRTRYCDQIRNQLVEPG